MQLFNLQNGQWEEKQVILSYAETTKHNRGSRTGKIPSVREDSNCTSEVRRRVW